MRILVIGDLDGQFTNASMIASKNGAKVSQVKNDQAALDNLRAGLGADMVLMHVKSDIKSFIEKSIAEKIFIPVIACGFVATAEEASLAIENGAVEYMPLPPNEELIIAILHSITNNERPVIFQSEIMQNVINLINKVAISNAPILLSGKSGTGKEVLSNYIYQKSARAKKQFIAINCAAVPENLLESEFFGHEKGAFTGAIARRIGKFEEANGGTILLDEISEIDVRLQSKLLRTIQEREITRIGSNESIKLDIRIIATTNRDLETEVKNGRFREDLFFRLNVINVEVPELSQRGDDIKILTDYFIKKYSQMNNFLPLPLAEETTTMLMQHAWPGNVRELENTIHRAVLLANGDGHIKPEHLMLKSQKTEEKEQLKSMINYCKTNANAATILGISITDLEKKLSTL